MISKSILKYEKSRISTKSFINLVKKFCWIYKLRKWLGWLKALNHIRIRTG